MLCCTKPSISVLCYTSQLQKMLQNVQLELKSLRHSETGKEANRAMPLWTTGSHAAQLYFTTPQMYCIDICRWGFMLLSHYGSGVVTLCVWFMSLLNPDSFSFFSVVKLSFSIWHFLFTRVIQTLRCTNERRRTH